MSTALHPPRETWERVKAADSARVAELLGLEPARERGKWNCPKHGGSDSLHAYAAERGGGFHCFACGEHFSTVDLAAVAWGCEPAEACFRLAQALGVPVGENRPPRMPQERRSAPRPPHRPTPTRATTRPPRGELLELWEASRHVDDDAEAAAWLTSRGLDPATVAQRDLARAIPPRASVPAWASYRGPWSVGPWRLLVPLYGATGELESVQARAIQPSAEPKAVSPQGGNLAGLAFADPLGLWLLQERVPAWWARPYRVVVAEGVPDFLTWATHYSDDEIESAPAVLGVMAGTWTRELAARIPDGARVTIRTDHDKAGDAYAERIVDTLRGRCTILRSKEAS